MPLEFTKGTDQVHQVKLDSTVMAASWVANRVVAGHEAEVEVRTSFVGSGAPLEIEVKTEDGDDGGNLRDVIRNNVFRGRLTLSENLPVGALIYFDVKLPGSGNAEGRSNSVPVVLPPRISKLKWSAAEARRGDILVLSASVKDVPVRCPATVEIYEFDEDGAHDLITSLTGEVLEDRLEVRWLFQYTEDTDEIPSQDDLDPYGNDYRHPEYFFVVDIDGFRVGEEQESRILRFTDHLEIRYDGSVQEASQYEVVLVLPDGSERTSEFDDNGIARFDDVPAGRCRARFREKESDS